MWPYSIFWWGTWMKFSQLSSPLPSRTSNLWMNSKMNLLVTQTLKPLILKKKIVVFRKDKNFQLLIICDKLLKMKPLYVCMCVYSLPAFSEFASINLWFIKWRFENPSHIQNEMEQWNSLIHPYLCFTLLHTILSSSTPLKVQCTFEKQL